MLLAVVMAVGLLPLSACSGGTSAATMHLRRTEGTVSVSDNDGKSVTPMDNLGLYSGYGVGTRSASYAWIDLDDVKLAKLDQNSEISIEKDGKKLDIQLKSGSLYFNVTQPLEDDETMDIRTSTLLVGIRGTSGWVEDRSGLSRVYILEGKVECSAEGQTVRVSAGEMAELRSDGELAVEPFTAEDIPAFVREDADPGLIGGPDATESPAVSESPEPSETPKPSDGPAGEVLDSGDCGEGVTWTYYSDGVLTIGGEGRMDDYIYMGMGERPWKDYSEEIHTVVIGDGVIRMGTFAFSGLWNLASVTLGSGVGNIGLDAFAGCTSLTGMVIPENIRAIDERAFSNCGLTSVTIPGSVTDIAASAFDRCTDLTDVTLGDGVTRIDGMAFYGCLNLTGVTIPASVTYIGGDAFSGCDSLADIYYGGSESQWNQLIGVNAASIPAWATIHYAVADPGSEPPAGGNPSSHIGLTMSGGSYSEVDDPPVYTRDAFYDWEEDAYWYESLDGCFTLSPETQLTISNLANADDNCYIDDICLWTDTYYDSDENSCYLDGLYFYHLTNNDGFIAHMMYRDPEYGGPVQLRPGESVTLLLSEYRTLADEFGEVFITYDLLVLAVSLTYPDAGQSEIVYYGFTFNE